MSNLLASLLPDQNISYYTIPIAWMISIAPHVYTIHLFDKHSSGSQGFDHSNPRHSVANLDRNKTLDEATKATIARAEAAQLNGFENLGLFAAAVVAANAARIDVKTVNLLSLSYLLNRVLFNMFYIRGVKGFVRGAPFYTALLSTFTLFIKAGNALRRAGY